MRIIYLHGFASGPGSRKAQVFRARFEEAGVSVAVPHLDGGNFFSLTISGQYDILSREANGEPVVLVGSSMGGYLAALYASADVFIFPSRTDTFGVVLLEALACGLPVASAAPSAAF